MKFCKQRLKFADITGGIMKVNSKIRRLQMKKVEKFVSKAWESWLGFSDRKPWLAVLYAVLLSMLISGGISWWFYFGR
jgi:hypothetical protein